MDCDGSERGLRVKGQPRVWAEGQPRSLLTMTVCSRKCSLNLAKGSGRHLFDLEGGAQTQLVPELARGEVLSRGGETSGQRKTAGLRGLGT